MSTTLDTNQNSTGINFALAEKSVKKLQKRIGEAYKKNDMELVAYLQHTLIHSRSAKMLAVKNVLRKSGCKYPGIDNVKWDTFEEGFNSILSFKPSQYKPSPLKRIYFTKSNGKRRPIGIPTLHDRAVQTLYKFALEPISEIWADKNSFAYRKGRSAKDAIKCINNILNKYPEFNYVVKVDIRSCFDSISQEWLLRKIPFDVQMLSVMLKCGYIEKGNFYMPERGIPQGGCLSSVLCNMTLDGIEALLAKHFGPMAMLVRYADDIVIFASHFFRATDVLSVLKKFLTERELELSEEKTLIAPLSDGFDFLGYHIAKRNNTVVCIPAKGKKEKYLNSIKEALNKNANTSIEDCCKILSPRIEGWLNYYNGVVHPYNLYEFEYDTIMYINSLTDNTTLAAAVGEKIFSKYPYLQ